MKDGIEILDTGENPEAPASREMSDLEVTALSLFSLSMVPIVRGSQGKSKYQGAKVNKDAEKNFNCVQQFKNFLPRSQIICASTFELFQLP